MCQTGNKKSLGDPMKKGVDMRGKMLELYKKNYLAGRMKLSILGGGVLLVCHPAFRLLPCFWDVLYPRPRLRFFSAEIKIKFSLSFPLSFQFAFSAHLLILSAESLETLKEWAVELFGEVKEGGNDKKSPTWSGPIWEKGKFYRVESVKDQHLLSLMWPLPCLEAAYLKKPQDYISHLVGHGILFASLLLF